jgi:hypothetical protein
MVTNNAIFPSNVTIAWDPNSESDLAGYKVYIGTVQAGYFQVIDVGNITQYNIASQYFQTSNVYYFVVTAYNLSHLESSPSNEVSTYINVGGSLN